LDYLVELTRGVSKVYGSRMMGGGFGGCTINLIENNAVEEISKSISVSYEEKFHIKPEIYTTSISSGTNIINMDGNETA
jgi:galactokinase